MARDKMSDAVLKVRLSNGLLVLLKEIHTAPLISQWIWYRIGSRDERPGITGSSHWVEHMQFKGTQQFPGGVLDKQISREGGLWNASTYLDWTAYFETMPADKIDLALRLEADRMQNSLFEPAEVEAERTVIISERQGSENEPLFQLNEQVQAAAFRVHPYHHDVIGDLADLQFMQRDDLYRHYRTYYVPNNAVLALAGDFDAQRMLERVRELYEVIPAGGEPPRAHRPEPEQNGERRVTVEGPGDTIYIQMVWHVQPATHPDFMPLTVMDSLLTGPSSPNIFGGGISNKTSHLYQALVEGELGVSVSGGLHATVDPYLYSINTIVHPQKAASDPDGARVSVINAIDEQIERLCDSPPSPQELERAVKQARALFAYSTESITDQASWLGFTEMFASYDWFVNYLNNLASVTPEDVQRVAQTYLRPQNRVLGIYLPTDGYA